MPYAVWPNVPWLDFEHWDEFPVAEIRNDGHGRVRTVALVEISRRHYRLPEHLSVSERQTLETFLRARGWRRDPFLLEDPKDAERAAVALEPSTGDASRVTFSLPTTTSSEEYRHYPKQGAVVGKVAGTPAALASVDTDARTITFAAAPGAGAAVTADFTGLRLCRLVSEPRFRGLSVDWFSYEAELEEILRE